MLVKRTDESSNSYLLNLQIKWPYYMYVMLIDLYSSCMHLYCTVVTFRR